MSEPAPEIIEQVNELMRAEFEIPGEKLLPTSTLKGDLGLDSLDAVDLLVYLEESLGAKLEAEKLADVRTLGDVYVLAAASLSRAQA